jgi:hypothetical protein
VTVGEIPWRGSAIKAKLGHADLRLVCLTQDPMNGVLFLRFMQLLDKEQEDPRRKIHPGETEVVRLEPRVKKRPSLMEGASTAR